MKKAVSAALLLILVNTAVFSQNSGNNQTGNVNINDESTQIYFIKDVEFDIVGWTRGFAILDKTEIRIGEEIQGKSLFNAYIEYKAQVLVNQRVLSEVSLHYSLEDPDERGRIPVILYIHAVDTWNFIVLPWIKYNSNTGR